MRVLTIRQPFAWVIIEGLKDIENRSWRPPSDIIGQRIAIHAGKQWHKQGLQWVETELGLRVPRGLIRGAIIGTAEIVGVVEASESPWFIGPLGWVLANPVRCAPVPMRGKLGLWKCPEFTEQSSPAIMMGDGRDSQDLSDRAR